MIRHAKSKTAFSLIELSIVIVIISLLSAVIVAGRNAIHRSQLAAQVTQIAGLKEAIVTFKDLYGQYPGDISNASRYWSSAINGNGDGNIGSATATSTENTNAFAHLWNARLINQYYAGGGTFPTIGTNVMAAKMNNRFLYIGYDWPWNKGPVEANNIQISTGSGRNNSLTPADAYYLDNKLDDGLPHAGYVLGAEISGVASCAITTHLANITYPDTETYKLTEQAITCHMWFNVNY
jgi:prepilin-type N-terminal cleavage/methylation domain-containing protein